MCQTIDKCLGGVSVAFPPGVFEFKELRHRPNQSLDAVLSRHSS